MNQDWCGTGMGAKAEAVSDNNRGNKGMSPRGRGGVARKSAGRLSWRLAVATAVTAILLGLSAPAALAGNDTQTSAQSSMDQNLVKLVRDGRQLSKANVKQLESALKSLPLHLPTRARLLGFYFHSSRPIFGRTATIEARRRHILWLIKNHPESSIAGLPEAMIDPSGHELADEEGYRQAKELWLRQVDKKKDNMKVRLNAAKFVQLHDKTIAKQLSTDPLAEAEAAAAEAAEAEAAAAEAAAAEAAAVEAAKAEAAAIEAAKAEAAAIEAAAAEAAKAEAAAADAAAAEAA